MLIESKKSNLRKEALEDEPMQKKHSHETKLNQLHQAMNEYQWSQEKIKFRHEQEIKNIELKARKKREVVMELGLKLRAEEEILTEKDQIYSDFDKFMMIMIYFG